MTHTNQFYDNSDTLLEGMELEQFDFFSASPRLSAIVFAKHQMQSLKEEALFQPFTVSDYTENGHQTITIESESENESIVTVCKTKIIKKGKKARSEETKNICYNIVQKTIRVLMDGTYEQKMEQIAKKNGIDGDEFVTQILAIRKEFTGSKALSFFLQKNTCLAVTFSEFMKWFLENKYLRFALNHGQMKNIGEYIAFKNTFILPMLK